MQELTSRQRQILQMIQSYISNTGMPPTRTDICDHFGFRSPTAADDHLKALERKGAIELVPGASRGIRIIQSRAAQKRSQSRRSQSKRSQSKRSQSRLKGRKSGAGLMDSLIDDISLPVVGRVAAGEPVTSEEHIEDYHQVDPNLFNPRADYLLRVRGMSMRDAGILDGDLLAVHSTPEAYNRQIVVARVDDEVTVKRFRQRGNIVTLLPENEDFEPIRVDLRKQSFSIEGIYAGILRLKEDGSST